MPADWLYGVITRSYLGPGMNKRKLYSLADYSRITDADAVQSLAWASDGVGFTLHTSI